MRFIKYLNEDATEKAYKTLQAIISSLENSIKKRKEKKSDVYKENGAYKMAVDINKFYNKNKSFSKDQAQWIYKMSQALFK